MRQRGFTLIELVIVLLVISILVALGYPSYQEQIRKSRRAQVKADMMELAQLAERWYTTNTTYQTFAIPAGLNVSPRTGGTVYYNLRIEVAPRAFTLTAVPQGPQAQDRCGTLTLDHANRRTQSTGTAEECW
ncbi:MAG: type IV pilin protein [Xanthomonadales bacterium]|nr:type IV pilin protein [Xanthomonadales bacterium]